MVYGFIFDRGCASCAGRQGPVSIAPHFDRRFNCVTRHMTVGLTAQLWAGVLATSLLEIIAVLLGLMYEVPAVLRSRCCWVVGGVSSVICVGLFARARLPMQSLLQIWYVGIAVFGFLRWSHEAKMRVSLLPWRGHVAAVAGWLLLAARPCPGCGDADGLALSGRVDHGPEPLCVPADGARGRLENWLYWIVVDGVQAWLYSAQGLVFTAGLFVIYLIIAAAGFLEWWEGTSHPECWVIPASVLRLIPGCAGGEPSQHVQRLFGGRKVNRTLRIDTRTGRFVLRQRIGEGPRPGADALREVACHRTAAAAGVAPAVLNAAPDGSWILMDYVEGGMWTAPRLQATEGLRTLCAAL